MSTEKTIEYPDELQNDVTNVYAMNNFCREKLHSFTLNPLFSKSMLSHRRVGGYIEQYGQLVNDEQSIAGYCYCQLHTPIVHSSD